MATEVIDAPAKAAPIVLDVTGMTCAACAARIEKVLSRTPGIEAANVNLALERAEVVAPSLAATDIVAAIERAGFGARPRGADAAARRLARARLDAEHRAEARRTFALFVGSALLTMPFMIAMAQMLWGAHPHWLTPTWQILLATPVQFIAGARFYRGAAKALMARAANMDVLVALGTSSAYFFSLAMVISHGAAAEGHLYFEASSAVITLVLMGKLLESRAKQGATAALSKLAQLRPEVATRLVDGHVEIVPVDRVTAGDIVLVKPGERVPVDGTIIDGASTLDESLVTGESLPVTRAVGDAVITGTINGAGALQVRATATGEDTALARIVRLVEAAQVSKAPVQRLVDQVASVFVPIVIGIALVTFVSWWLISGDLEAALVPAVSVLVIACPCALGLATPTALVAGTGAAARHGILIRDIEALERAVGVTVVVFDKTGTLTEGHPAVTDVMPYGATRDEVLALAARVEIASEHPLAKAIVAAAQATGAVGVPATGLSSTVGEGVRAVVDGETVGVGNRRLAVALGVAPAELEAIAADETRLLDSAKTTLMVVRGGRVMGLIGLADPVRPQSAEAVSMLRARGIAVRLLTGDAAPVAAAIARAVGIDTVEAGVKPARKADVVSELKRAGQVVAMVGDGVNDAPALAGADLSIAIGSGADVAVETAGVTLMRSDPRLVPAALEIARATVAKIRQNLFWAFIYNIIGLPLAALGLLSPAFAGFAMAMSSVSVVSNAWLLTRWRLKGL